MLDGAGTQADRLGPVAYRPGSGLALVGRAVVVFLPEPMDHPLLDEIADLVDADEPGAAAAIGRAVLRADMSPLPPFVLVERDVTGWHLVARGAIPIEIVQDGVVSRLDASAFDVALEHRTVGEPEAIRIGAAPDHGLFTVSGSGVVPAAGLSLVASLSDAPWSQGRDTVAEVFERTASIGHGVAAVASAPDAAEPDRILDGQSSEVAVSRDGDGGAPSSAYPDSELSESGFGEFDQSEFGVGEFDQSEFEQSEFGDGEFGDGEFGDGEFDDGPVGAVADLFGVAPAEPLVSPPASPATSIHDVAAEPLDDRSEREPVHRATPDPTVAVPRPPEASSGAAAALGPVAVPNATNMPSKTEIDRMREQLRADLAGTGQSTTHASASLVRGRSCPNGHLNEFTDASCRQCGESIPFDAVTTTGPRPRLGRLEFDSGQVVNLDRPVVIGRNPPTDHVVGGETANPVTVGDIDMRISSFHVKVYFEGWNVVAENPGSTNATWISLPSGQRTELRRGQPMVIRPGTTVTMADRRSFTYLVP